MYKKCICCCSTEIINCSLRIKNYLTCLNCGLIYKRQSTKHNSRNEIIRHYSHVDPHVKVANAKRKIFQLVLESLEYKNESLTKSILDIGCGFGYFIEMAAKKGWNAYGVEIADEAVLKAKQKIGSSKVFHGTLKEADYEDNFFDVITLWDVLVEVDNPFYEIKECYRVLNEKGKIGIRVRNLLFQKIAYTLYLFLIKFKLESKIKKPYVFHKYCFTKKSLYCLLTRAGFKNIHITNSPLTQGDPYKYVKYNKIIKITKKICFIISKVAYWVSFGKLAVGPSLLVWAEKPYK